MWSDTHPICYRVRYPVSLLVEAATPARNKNRDELLVKATEPHPQKENNDKVFFISTYYPNNDKLTRI